MRGFGGFGGPMMSGLGWIGMVIGLVIMLAIIVGVVLLVVWLVRRTGKNAMVSSVPMGSNQPAKDIASARYARGEITRDEYQQIMTDLSKNVL
jgi:putative membrane protein